MTVTRARRALAAVLPLTVALLAACSGSGSGPAVGDLYKKMRETAKAATSAHVKGEMIQDNEKGTIDLAGSTDGSNQKLIVAVAAGSIEFLTVDKKMYMKADASFWEGAGEGAGSLLADKYITGPATAAASGANKSLTTLLDEMFKDGDLSLLDKLTTTVEKSQLGGQDVYVLKDKADSKSTITVSADGQATLLQIAAEGKGTLNFTEWNSVKPFTAPTADQIAEVPGT
jgi:hypothetical protein